MLSLFVTPSFCLVSVLALVTSVNAETCGESYQRVPGHTACMEKSSDVVESGVSDEDKKIIVDTHNKYRDKVNPTAANMLKLEWDDEVAKIAQKWADTCATGHDKARAIPGRYSVGQNLAWGYGSFEKAVTGWYNEYKDFKYGSKASNVFKKIGHYTQVVWANTKLVGCGYALCGTTKHHFCNYAPAGNNGDWSKPYKEGTPAESCPNNRIGNLCDCGECENDSPRDMSTCKCECKHTFQIGSKCTLDCAASGKSPFWGCKQYTYEKCAQFTNVPADCPNLCKVCPIDYGNTGDVVPGTTKNPVDKEKTVEKTTGSGDVKPGTTNTPENTPETTTAAGDSLNNRNYVKQVKLTLLLQTLALLHQAVKQ